MSDSNNQQTSILPCLGLLISGGGALLIIAEVGLYSAFQIPIQLRIRMRPGLLSLPNPLTLFQRFTIPSPANATYTYLQHNVFGMREKGSEKRIHSTTFLKHHA